MNESITVDTVRQFADDYRKDIVLLVSWDVKSNITNITTWGREPTQKEMAADAGNTIRKVLRLEDTKANEDYRREGETAMIVDDLRRRLSAIKERLSEIVVSQGEDAGVILLSDESPTHWDQEAKCQVYDYQNFSLLGDALVGLAKLADASL